MPKSHWWQLGENDLEPICACNTLPCTLHALKTRISEQNSDLLEGQIPDLFRANASVCIICEATCSFSATKQLLRPKQQSRNHCYDEQCPEVLSTQHTKCLTIQVSSLFLLLPFCAAIDTVIETHPSIFWQDMFISQESQDALYPLSYIGTSGG